MQPARVSSRPARRRSRESWVSPTTRRKLDRVLKERQKRTEMLIRAQSRGVSSVVSPYAAVAVCGDGSIYSSGVVVTPEAYTIRDAFQTEGGSTISIRLRRQPQVSPVGKTMRVRIGGGIHAATRGAHPADGTFVFAAGPNPYTFELVGSTWGGDYTYSVAGVSYTSSHVFGGGHCYVEGAAVDASEKLNALSNYARAHGGADVRYPNGGMYILNQRNCWRENCRYRGGGGKNTFFFVADSDDMIDGVVYHPFGTTQFEYDGMPEEYGNVSELYLEGFTVYGNRTHAIYRAGMHTFDYGADTDTGVSITVNVRDVHGIGSAGYGNSLGGYNFKVDCVFDQCSFTWSDGDNFDIKNRLSRDDRVLFRACGWGWHAMGDQGTNIGPTRALPNNPITTYTGSPRVSIARSNDTDANRCEFITIAGASSFDGIDPNGSWPCVDLDSTNIYFDIGQTPTAGGVTGGGSSATMFMPHISVGDCVVDFRGIRHACDGGTWTGENFQRNCFRQRPGGEEKPSGEGGTECTFRGLKGLDLSPAWMADTSGAGRGFVTLLGEGGIVYDITFRTKQSICFSVGSAAIDWQISKFRVRGARLGAQIRGERGKLHDGFFLDWIEKGVEVWGATSSVDIALPPDPFTATPGGSTVTVNAPDHSKTTGASVRFPGVVQGNGITIRLANENPAYTITVVDDGHFTISASGSALTADPWGGSSAQATFAAGDHDAVDNQIYNVTFIRTDDSTAKAISIGKSDGGSDGQASRTRLHGNTYIGDATTPWEDEGDDTDWAGLNSGGFPNNLRADTVTVPGLVTAGYQLIATYDYAVDGASSSIECHTLGAYSEIKVAAIELTHGSGSSQNWQVQVSEDNSTWKSSSGDYARDGSAAGTAGLVFCGSVAAATPAGGTVIIDMFNSAIKHTCTVAGGAKNASTGAQTQPGHITAATALQAVRLVNGGGVPTTGGTVYFMGKT